MAGDQRGEVVAAGFQQSRCGCRRRNRLHRHGRSRQRDDAGREHRVVGDPRPRFAVMHLGAHDLEAAHVDAVEAQHRQACWEAARPAGRDCRRRPRSGRGGRRADRGRELRQSLKSPATISGASAGTMASRRSARACDLAAARAAEQRQVHADAVQRLLAIPAASISQCSRPRRSNTQVAMMSWLCDGEDRDSATGWRCRGGRGRRRRCGRRRCSCHTSSARNSCCGASGQFSWPSAWPMCSPCTSCRKTMSGFSAAQALAQLVDHHAAVELRKALVDVVGGDRAGAHGCRSGRRCTL